MAQNPNAFGSFAEGLLGGIDYAQNQKLKNEEYQVMRDARRDRQETKAFRQELSGIPTSDITAPAQQLEGPPTANGQVPMKQSGAARLEEMRAKALALPAGPDREAALQQVDEVAVRGAGSMLALARSTHGKAPEEEAQFLNRAGELVGLGGEYFTVKGGQVVSPEGPVDDKTYGFMLHYLKNPTKAFEWMRTANMQDAEAARAERQLTLAEYVSEHRVNQAWTEMSQRWKALGLDERRLIQDQREFSQEYDLELKKLGVDQQLADAQSAYYYAKAAEANLEAKLLGKPQVWGKDSDLIKAFDQMNDQYANAMHPMFSDEYAQQLPQQPGAEINGEQLRFMATEIGKEAIAEHGAKAMADAVPGSIMALSALAGDPTVKVEDVQEDEIGRTFMIVDGKEYPISRDAGRKLTASLKGRQQQDETSMQGVMSGIQGIPIDGGSQQGGGPLFRTPPVSSGGSPPTPWAGLKQIGSMFEELRARHEKFKQRRSESWSAPPSAPSGIPVE